MTLNRPAERLASPRTIQSRLLASGIYATVHTEAAPSDGEWSAMVEELSQKSAQVRSVFVYTAGGAPTARQRKELGEMWAKQGNNPPAVVVMRGFLLAVITALNWFLKNPIRAFPPSDFERAIDCVVRGQEERAELLLYLERTCTQLRVPPLVDTLRANHARP